MRTELLKILRESDDYVSGQQLCDQFGVSRTAVWKAISQLREEGYDIEAVKIVDISWVQVKHRIF